MITVLSIYFQPIFHKTYSLHKNNDKILKHLSFYNKHKYTISHPNHITFLLLLSTLKKAGILEIQIYNSIILKSQYRNIIVYLWLQKRSNSLYGRINILGVSGYAQYNISYMKN